MKAGVRELHRRFAPAALVMESVVAFALPCVGLGIGLPVSLVAGGIAVLAGSLDHAYIIVVAICFGGGLAIATYFIMLVRVLAGRRTRFRYSHWLVMAVGVLAGFAAATLMGGNRALWIAVLVGLPVIATAHLAYVAHSDLLVAQLHAASADGPAKVRFGWIAGVATMAIAIFYLAMRDPPQRSCHVVSSQGQRPQVSFRLDISDDEWHVLRTALQDTARNALLSVEDSSRFVPSSVDVLAMSLCADDGRAIRVLEQRWVAPAPDCGRNCGITVHVYGRQDDWQALARDVSRRFNELWPGRVMMEAGGGMK
jgi:hypothetical protein